jgi:hypothetical protein
LINFNVNADVDEDVDVKANDESKYLSFSSISEKNEMIKRMMTTTIRKS